MIIEIAGGGYSSEHWGWILIPMFVVAAGFVWSLATTHYRDDVGPTVLVVVGVSFTVFYAIVFSSGVAPGMERAVQNAQKEAALEEKGFEHVDLSGDSFTASLDGSYFSGSLEWVAENTYRVIEKVEFRE